MKIDPHTTRGGRRVSEDDFCMQIWILHAILSKKYFCQLNSTQLVMFISGVMCYEKTGV